MGQKQIIPPNCKPVWEKWPDIKKLTQSNHKDIY